MARSRDCTSSRGALARIGDHHRRPAEISVSTRRQDSDLLLPEVIERLVARDGEEPSGEAGFGWVEAACGPRHGDPSLLVQVFRGVPMRGPQQPSNEVKARTIVPVVEPFERVRVPRGVGAQQIGVPLRVVTHQRPTCLLHRGCEA
jgi:hypothetical protein